MNTRLFSRGIFSKEKKTLLPQYTRNYGTLKESKPFLLEELRACITLLEAAKKKAPYKQPQLQRDYRRYAALFMSLALLGLSGTGGALTVMLIMMRIAHDNILPELQKQLQQLYDHISAIDKDIETNHASSDLLRKKYNQEHTIYSQLLGQISDLGKKWWEGMEWPDNLQNIFYKDIPIPISVNNCVEWNETTGRQKLINIFPEINHHHDNGDLEVLKEPCWFFSNNKTHPLPECADIATNLCTTNNQRMDIWYNELKPMLDQMNAIQRTNWELSDEKNNINTTDIPSMKSRINNPYSEPEPITNTIFSLVALLSIVGITYFAYRLYHSREAHHADLESHGNYIQRYLASIEPIQQTRIAKLALQLGSPIHDDMTIDFLLVLFKQKAQELELQRKQRMSFFAGVKIENAGAGNHQFLTNEASRDITKTIFEYADLMPKRTKVSPQ